MRRKIRQLGLVSLMMFVFYSTGYSQSCLSDGIVFTRQSQVDSFPINYPNCSKIDGDVTITGFDISNLSGLNTLTSVGGKLIIGRAAQPTGLSGFEGLNNLDTIYGGFGVENNSKLKSFSGLNHLTFIGGGFYVEGNDSLTSFMGLTNVHNIAGDIFWIKSNFGLINLLGFDNLSAISGDVDIYNNSVISLTGLEHLESIGGKIQIHQNYYLKELNGLENLISLGGDLVISSNDSLKNLDGVDNLKTVNGSFDIHYNDALKNLSGLNSLDSIKGNLSIYNNDSLSKCAVESICRFLSNPNGFINIRNNAPGCNSTEEIQSNCDTLGTPENFPVNQYILYPNPAFNEFTISNGAGRPNSGIKIFNQLGELVLKIERTNEPIRITNLRKGYYLVEFNGGEKVVRKHLLKY